MLNQDNNGVENNEDALEDNNVNLPRNAVPDSTGVLDENLIIGIENIRPNSNAEDFFRNFHSYVFQFHRDENNYYKLLSYNMKKQGFILLDGTVKSLEFSFKHETQAYRDSRPFMKGVRKTLDPFVRYMRKPIGGIYDNDGSITLEKMDGGSGFVIKAQKDFNKTDINLIKNLVRSFVKARNRQGPFHLYDYLSEAINVQLAKYLINYLDIAPDQIHYPPAHEKVKEEVDSLKSQISLNNENDNHSDSNEPVVNDNNNNNIGNPVNMYSQQRLQRQNQQNLNNNSNNNNNNNGDDIDNVHLNINNNA